MRYGRVSIDGEIRWVRVDDNVVHVLRSSPLEGDPVVERSRALEGLAFLPPVVPFVFYAVGLNYRRHIEEQIAAGRDVAVPDRRRWVTGRTTPWSGTARPYSCRPT